MKIATDFLKFTDVLFDSAYLRVSIGKNSCTDEILGSNYGSYYHMRRRPFIIFFPVGDILKGI